MIDKTKISKTELIESINFKELITNLKDAFVGLKSGKTVQPEQMALIAPNKDDCIIYTAADFSKNIVGIKLSPFIFEKTQKGQNPVTAYTLLLSMKTGMPLLLCDSFHLTSLRTAATSVLAVSKLKPKTNKLAIIGFGNIGQDHLRISNEIFDFNSINIFSPSTSTDKNKGLNILKKIDLKKSQSEIEFSSSIEDCIKNADVVMLCTSSKTSILDATQTKEDCIITSIVTNAPTAHEISPESLIECDIYCDYLPNCLNVAGEFKILKEKNILKDLNIISDLSYLCDTESQVEINVLKRRYFRSVGLGIEDVIIANSII